MNSSRSEILLFAFITLNKNSNESLWSTTPFLSSFLLTSSTSALSVFTLIHCCRVFTFKSPIIDCSLSSAHFGGLNGKSEFKETFMMSSISLSGYRNVA
ncbi:hypothetical protein Saci_1043 [Sulfolobus acidocaldarius DSM 639]|uniref:Uncharacterized protein n=1 Tax=Sulfolobus acidocaldarius (strain ATCC 33909 / DSM 639 / JCM 8929 / NBRC 15157 / NCIMB 11770) TaxID=330779 RepID=Q4J9Y0_SULAC|nr:hypothetical protein Saci_1043 [Sulfolobus acidocaldarius DSM 639]